MKPARLQGLFEKCRFNSASICFQLGSILPAAGDPTRAGIPNMVTDIEAPPTFNLKGVKDGGWCTKAQFMISSLENMSVAEQFPSRFFQREYIFMSPPSLPGTYGKTLNMFHFFHHLIKLVKKILK